MSKKTTVTEAGTVVRGEVKITKLKGNKVVSVKKMNNNAVANLLIGVARFIRGDFLHLGNEGVSFIPAYLGVGYTESDLKIATTFDQTSLANELSSYKDRFDVTKGDVKLTASDVRLSLSAVIPSGIFNSGTRINELGLFSQRNVSASGMLARVVYKLSENTIAKQSNDASGDYHIKIETGMSYRIDWNIILSNK